MGNSLSVSKLASKLKVTGYDVDPDATSLTDVQWVPMKDLYGLLVMLFRTIGTSDAVLKIIANAKSDGSGTDYVVKTKTFTAGQPNAVGDYVFLEVLQQEVAQIGAENSVNLAYVSAQVSFETGTDEAVVVYIGMPTRYKYDGLTADYIST